MKKNAQAKLEGSTKLAMSVAVKARLDKELQKILKQAGKPASGARPSSLASGTKPAGAVPAQNGQLVEVVITASDVEKAKQAVNGLGGKVTFESKLAKTIAALVPANSITALQLSAGITGLNANRKYGSSLAQSVPEVNAPLAWATGYNGSGVRIAIVDSGVDSGHSMLKGRVVEEKDFTSSGTVMDQFGHGTHVAGIAAGSNASGGLYNGVAPGALLINAKVLDASGFGTTQTIIAGLDWAANPDGNDTTPDGAKVVSISFGGAYDSSDEPLAAEIRALVARGIAVVAAAGNCGVQCPASYCAGFTGVTFPGTMPEVITVGTVDKELKAVCFSAGGSVNGELKPDLVAPGIEITSSIPGGYRTASGTSMSTPFVSGAAAILLQKYPDIPPTTLKLLLESTASDLGAPGKDAVFGTGLLDLNASMQVNLSDYTNLTLTLPSAVLRGDDVVVAVNTSVEAASVIGKVLQPSGATVPISFTKQSPLSWAAVINGTDTEDAGSYFVTTVSGGKSAGAVFAANNFSLDLPAGAAFNESVAIALRYKNFEASARTASAVVAGTDGIGSAAFLSQSQPAVLQNGSTTSFNWQWKPNSTGLFAFNATLLLDGAASGSVQKTIYVAMPRVLMATAAYLPPAVQKGDNASFTLTAANNGGFDANASVEVYAVLQDKLLKLVNSQPQLVSPGTFANLTATGVLPLQGGSYAIIAYLVYGDQRIAVQSNLLVTVPPKIILNITAAPAAIQFSGTYNFTATAQNTFSESIETNMRAQVLKDGVVAQEAAIGGLTIAPGQASAIGFQLAFTKVAGEVTLRIIADYENSSSFTNQDYFVKNANPPRITLNFTQTVQQASPTLVAAEVVDESDLVNASATDFDGSTTTPLQTTVSSVLNYSTITAADYATFSLGSHTVTVTACDEQGNCASQQAAFAVVACNATGGSVLAVEESGLFSTLLAANNSYCVAQWKESLYGNVPEGYANSFDAVVFNFDDAYRPVSAADAALMARLKQGGRRVGLVAANAFTATLQDNPASEKTLENVFAANLRGRIYYAQGFATPADGILVGKNHFHTITRGLPQVMTLNQSPTGAYDLLSAGSGVIASFNSTRAPAIVQAQGPGKAALAAFTLAGLQPHQAQVLASNFIKWLVENATTEITLQMLTQGSYFTESSANRLSLKISATAPAIVEVFFNGTKQYEFGAIAGLRTYSIDGPALRGAYKVRAQARTANGEGEGNYFDNALERVVRVASSQPDVSIYSVTHLNLSASNSQVQAILTNYGGSDASAEVSLYVNSIKNGTARVKVMASAGTAIAFNFTVAPGPYTFSVNATVAGNYNPDPIGYSEKSTACTGNDGLVVSDDANSIGTSSSADEFARLLTAQGYCVSRWSTAKQGSVSYFELNKHDFVVWSAGQNWNRTFSVQNPYDLQVYKRPVLFEGSNLLFDNGNNPAFTELAQANFSSSTALSNDTPVLPSNHSILANISSLVINASLNEFSDEATAFATPVAFWPDGAAAITASNSPRPVVYFAFSLPAVEGEQARNQLLSNSVAWLLAGKQVTLHTG